MLTRYTTTATLLLAAAFVFGSCTHSIHLVHVSDFTPYGPYAEGKLIQATTKQTSIMGFSFNTDYVDRAMRKLAEQCGDGRVGNITTQYSTSHGFFHWTNKILVQGLCVRG